MIKTDKQLMKEGKTLEALGDNYQSKPHSATIWYNGWEDYKKRNDKNVIKTKNYSVKYEMIKELNKILKEYPNAYHIVNDANCWL